MKHFEEWLNEDLFDDNAPKSHITAPKVGIDRNVPKGNSIDLLREAKGIANQIKGAADNNSWETVIKLCGRLTVLSKSLREPN